jgi:hypothetical protein
VNLTGRHHLTRHFIITRTNHHYPRGNEMGVLRYDNKYAAPTNEQRERYMTGKSEEHHFGPDGQIMLIEYHEAAYLKDDIDDIRILFTGFLDKQAHDEVNRLVEYHQQKEPHKNLFTTGRQTNKNSMPADHKSG